MPEDRIWDILVIGAGMGGAAFASRFADSDIQVLIVERGDYLPTEPENWMAREVISHGRYESDARWETQSGRRFHPRIYFNVGGNSKFFGGSAFRYREDDFNERVIDDTVCPSWPISYQDLEPWYDEAEKAMKVHGRKGADPSEASRKEYPREPLLNEDAIEGVARRLKSQGLHPFPLPSAVDQGEDGRCRKGSPCDGFPCRIRAKGDAENAFLRPVLSGNDNVRLETGVRIDRLLHDESGKRIVGAVGTKSGSQLSYKARWIVLAAGAAESATLLLRSKTELHPQGLSNSSGLVGCNFMAHNNSVLMAINPLRRNPTIFQKTLAINDFYFPGNPSAPKASGNIQMRGKIRPENLESHPSFFVRIFRRFIARHSFDFWVMSEDLPLEENRIEIRRDGGIRLSRFPTNISAHLALVEHMRRILKKCGFPIVLIRKPRLEAVQHQCGTLRFGDDPATSVFNPDCRSHEIENLYACDAGVFPSSAAVNPALTVAANALRVGEGLRRHISSRR